MSFASPERERTHSWIMALLFMGFSMANLTPDAVMAGDLRVCADPNNLPFSNQTREGFENKIVELVAKELGEQVTYVWWAQRRGFIRNTLKAGRCDLVAGVPTSLEMLRTTAPYYRSSYVFVTKREGPDVSTFDDPRLHKLRIGVQLVGDDGANPPPVVALARRGMVGQLTGYPVYGDYSLPSPAAGVVMAVSRADVDVAIAWGPLAGYFAKKEGLRVIPVSGTEGDPALPMSFDISMGVRKGNDALAQAVESALEKHRPEIRAILAAYGVPLVESGPGAAQ